MRLVPWQTMVHLPAKGLLDGLLFLFVRLLDSLGCGRVVALGRMLGPGSHGLASALGLVPRGSHPVKVVVGRSGVANCCVRLAARIDWE